MTSVTSGTTPDQPAGSIGLSNYHYVFTDPLFRTALRACYGIGRGGRAKIVPIALGGLAVLPAVLAVGISARAAQAPGGAGTALDNASPVRFDSYHGLIVVLVILFAAAFVAHREGIEWLAIILAISGIVGVIETVRGWCVLRACKIKTRF